MSGTTDLSKGAIFPIGEPLPEKFSKFLLERHI